MYSKIPMPHRKWTKENMRFSLVFFPLIGVVIGALVYLWCLFAVHFHVTSLLRAAVIVLIPVFVTGGIHLDGYLDTTDALSSYKSREERLAILKDSHTGAFAIIGACAYFLLYLGAAAQLDLKSAAAFASVFVYSRIGSAISVLYFNNANPKGTAAYFKNGAEKRTVTILLLVLLVLLSALGIVYDTVPTVSILIVCLLSFLWYRHMSYKNFGGITGDLAGFFVSVTEVAALCAVVLVQIIMR